ncbi:HIR1 [Candida theae]|uniref:Protein HIR n=1 Tax=Candida theae TaxID=1198502 RepID=A0AAD5BDN5_9ASCO|nr:HIR1 [Candida theae]KAI5957478.1 HIR1 [Candida theae]
MQILKIPWLGHKAENKKVECYTVTINAQGTRLASGGLDGCIKIWDTNTINSFFNISDKPYNKNKRLQSSASNRTTAASSSVDVEFTPDLPDKSLRRALCSMSRHNGAVTSLKFSPDGRWLASGSDDKIVLIWEKDNSQIANSFGAEQADLEHWTVRKRLVAHDNDIQDICWSPDGNLLVTVGLDRSIIIWNALTFEKIKRYDIHQSMVKGIVFDPANKFFATASDDRTVRVFRYYKKMNEYNSYEFQMEHVVVDPLRKSPLTSYFRRMSWSPDGQHLAVPNATNGPVPSVAIVNRGNWGSDVSLIGHEAPVEVCSFSPRLFQIDTDLDNDELKFQTVLATGGQDRTLAVWSTSNSKPIVVCQDIVDNSITDICWAPDGETLYFSCLDGSVCCVHFTNGELGQVVSEELIDQQLNRYGADRESTILPESVEQLRLEENATEARAIAIRKMMPLETVKEKVSDNTEASKIKPFDKEKLSAPLTPALKIDASRLRKQTVSVTKSGKKRVAPLLVSSASSSSSFSSSLGPSSSNIASAKTMAQPETKKRKLQVNAKLSQSNYVLPRRGLQTSVAGFKERDSPSTTNTEQDEDNDNLDIGGGVNTLEEEINTSQLSESALKRHKNRQKRKLLETKYPHSFKQISHLPETLFANTAFQNTQINKIYKAYANNNKDISADLSRGAAIDFDEDLMFSVVVSKTRHQQKGNAILNESEVKNVVTTTVEVRNGKPWHENAAQNDRDFDDPTKVIVYNDHDGEDRCFTLFFPFRIQSVLPILNDDDGQLTYFVLCSFNGSLQIVSAKTGRYILPTIELLDNVVSMKYSNDRLLVMTSSGLFYGWNLKTLTVYMNKVSVATVLNSFDVGGRKYVGMPSVRALEMNHNDGTPYILMDFSNDVFGYSLDLDCWIKVIDSWYFNVGTQDVKGNLMARRMYFGSKFQFDQSALMGSTQTYKFDDAASGVLKDTMVRRSKEMISMIK